MGSRPNKYRSTRILGAAIILGTLGWSLGAYVWNFPAERSTFTQSDQGDAPSAVSGPKLEPVPRREFPLTLANRPSAPGKGVVNADYTIDLVNRH